MAAGHAEDDFNVDEILTANITPNEIIIPAEEILISSSHPEEYFFYLNLSDPNISLIENESQPELVNTTDFSSVSDIFKDLEDCDRTLTDNQDHNLESFIPDNAAKEQTLNNKGNEQSQPITKESSVLQNFSRSNEIINDLSSIYYLSERDFNLHESTSSVHSTSSGTSLETYMVDNTPCEYFKSHNKQYNLNTEEIVLSSSHSSTSEKPIKYVHNKNMPLEENIMDDTLCEYFEPHDKQYSLNTEEIVLSSSCPQTREKPITYVRNQNLPLEEYKLNPVSYLTPIKKVVTLNTRQNEINFKTPKNSTHGKNNNVSPRSMTKSPGTINNYKHVVSPVARYINKSPGVVSQDVPTKKL